MSDMEHLTKQQIVLLTLLVSFVSSIATGIVTVSLLEQAPPTVTQTINRVVERTIEQVTPSATTTIETVVIRDDEATTKAIEKAVRSIVRIEKNGRFVGLGIIITDLGKIIAHTDAREDGAVRARLEGGNETPLILVSFDDVSKIAIYQAEQGTDLKSRRAYTGATLADSDSLKLGQAAVLIGGNETAIVSTGIVSALQRGAGPPGKQPVISIISSVRDSAFDSQAILVNLLGEVVGLKKGQSPENGFIPSNIIKTYATP
jgi:hypothetical protein